MKHEAVVLDAEFSEDAKKIQIFAKEKGISLLLFGPDLDEQRNVLWRGICGGKAGFVLFKNDEQKCYFVQAEELSSRYL